MKDEGRPAAEDITGYIWNRFQRGDTRDFNYPPSTLPEVPKGATMEVRPLLGMMEEEKQEK